MSYRLQSVIRPFRKSDDSFKEIIITKDIVQSYCDDYGILDDYIIRCYDVLHTQGKEYLVEDITEFVREKEVDV